jgi:UDP-N-acetylmuramoyl-tripeptide--D-alanyl-D-alanine ligase
MVAMFRPHIGVVTNVGHDHHSSFRTLEATAKEKGVLVEALPANGTAVLNADDPWVLAMRERTKAQVITYGLSEEAMVRGTDLVSAWPDPLSLSVVYKGERRRVETQLLGELWASAVLAALATGIAMGVPLAEAAAALKGVPPVYNRLSVHRMADDVTFILDTWKAPLYTIPASRRVLETARAPRKIFILGSISDYPGSASPKYRQVAREALEVADQVIFVSRWAKYALRARPPQSPQRLLAFENIYELRPFLRNFIAPGDLVLLKGSNRADHLDRLVLDWEREFPCWRLNCGLMILCNDCRLRRSHFVPVSEPG